MVNSFTEGRSVPVTSTISRPIARTLTTLIVGLAVITLSGCSLLGNIIGSNGDAGTVKGNGDQTDVFTIKVGQCLNDAAASGEVSSVPVVDCTKPHDTEAFKSIELTEDTYPGDTAISDRAETECDNAFESFVGIAVADSTSIVDAWYLPTADSWAGGDREILCLVGSVDADRKPVKTTGSLKGAAK
jgi:Septum formation